MKIKGIFFMLLFYVFSVSLAASYSYAEGPKVIIGFVEEIRGTSITVDGSDYDISGVPIFSVRGGTLSRDQLQVGSKVELIIGNDAVTKIVIMDNIGG